ncbi:MAG: signal peptidase I [Gemmatimonadota bacterium]|nr:signal peptidase I [Gemmatimonadota bacterium]
MPPKRSVTIEYIKAILLAFVLALFIRIFVVQAFRIPSGSMENTLLIGDFLLANKFIYGARIPFTDIRLPAWRSPDPGDIVIFQYPRDLSRDFIKRIVAGPGQKVEIKDKILYVDDKRAIDPSRAKYIDSVILKRRSVANTRDNYGPKIVPEDCYFVMGDNRDSSEDSRYWGFLKRDLIRGKAFVLYWSWAPDDRVPAYSNVTSLFGIALYNLFHFPERVRWRRIGMLVE